MSLITKKHIRRKYLITLLIVFVIGALGIAAILARYPDKKGNTAHKDPSSDTSSHVSKPEVSSKELQNSEHSTNNDTASALVVKEWGMQLPLSSEISDAYYAVSTSTQDANGDPNTMWLGIRSIGGCNASQFNTTGQGSPIGSLIRVAPTDADPVSGDLYVSKYPDGVTLGKYYYAFVPWKSRDCGSQLALDKIDAAFKDAAKNGKSSQ